MIFYQPLADKKRSHEDETKTNANMKVKLSYRKTLIPWEYIKRVKHC